jgi:SAM-dependent methyltransferase
MACPEIYMAIFCKAPQIPLWHMLPCGHQEKNAGRAYRKSEPVLIDPRGKRNEMEYYEQARVEMLAFLPHNTRRLLDIGCGEGLFGAAVKRRFPECETWGVEVVAEAAKKAAECNDHVINRSLDDAPDIPDGYFDVVSMNDVLEHIAWPATTLAAAKRMLAAHGKLILSLPNVAYYLNVRDLVFKNSWEYSDYGVLDRTHLRFYTTRSAQQLLCENGYEVELIKGINESPPKLHYRLLFALAPRFFQWMRFPQFAVVARPK